MRPFWNRFGCGEEAVGDSAGRGGPRVLGGIPEALGRGFGATLAPRMAWDSKREAKTWFVARFWVPNGTPIFDVFCEFEVFFCIVFSSLCFERCRVGFLMDCGLFLICFFDVFLRCCGLTRCKENVVSIHDLLCFTHIRLFEKQRNSVKKTTQF